MTVSAAGVVPTGKVKVKAKGQKAVTVTLSNGKATVKLAKFGKTGKKKVIAFLEPFYTQKYGLTLKGTYSTAVDPAGDKLYVTWNVSRGSRAWDCCGITVIHIPASERE